MASENCTGEWNTIITSVKWAATKAQGNKLDFAEMRQRDRWELQSVTGEVANEDGKRKGRKFQRTAKKEFGMAWVCDENCE